MNIWYMTMRVVKEIEEFSKIYYAPLKRNRLLDDSDGVAPTPTSARYSLDATKTYCGKQIHLKNCLKGHQAKLFRILSDTGRTLYCQERFIQLNAKAKT